MSFKLFQLATFKQLSGIIALTSFIFLQSYAQINLQNSASSSLAKVNSEVNSFEALIHPSIKNSFAPQLTAEVVDKTDTVCSGEQLNFNINGDQPLASMDYLDLASTNDGESPNRALLEYQGKFYGTTSGGGNGNGYGTLYEYDPITQNVKLLHSFNPADGSPELSSLIESNGNLYGVTGTGGVNGHGTIYEYSISGNSYTILHSFNNFDGKSPSSRLLKYNNKLYGVTSQGGANSLGTLFEYDISLGGVNVLHSFNPSDAFGYFPLIGLMESNGKLIGTTAFGGSGTGGTLFEYSFSGGMNLLHAFNSATGSNPSSILLEYSGIYYGVAANGGANSSGVIYKYDPNGTGFSVLHSFNGTDGEKPNGDLLVYGGELYGTTSEGGGGGLGTIFKYGLSAGGYSLLYSFNGPDGENPFAALIEYNGLFYGVASSGGEGADGVIFQYDLTNGLTVLHSFFGSEVGYSRSSLVEHNGKFYGTSPDGGGKGVGAIFEYDTNANGVNVLHSFKTSDGSSPNGKLIEVNDKLYGTTSLGGANGEGTIYEYDLTANSLTTLHSFNTSDGSQPKSSLLAYNGKFYGTTSSGGTNDNGTIFEYNPSGSVLTVLHSFNGTDGNNPSAGLTELGGKLYGTTYSGGANSVGTIFQYNLSNSTFTLLHSFNTTDGSSPQSVLLESNGNLYGTTSSGGTNDDGTIFEYDILGTSHSVLHHFDVNTDGDNPQAGLTEIDCKFYGTTLEGGVHGYGSLYEYDIPSGVLSILFDFQDDEIGISPSASLLDYDGILFGLTSAGGNGFGGSIFKYKRGFGNGFTYTVTSSDPTNVAAGTDRTTPSLDPITDTYINNTGQDVTITYTITPAWSNGCSGISFTYTVVVNSAIEMTPSTSVSQISCNGNNDGSVTLTAIASGGTASYDYTYNWSNAETTQNLSGLAPGGYTATINVTDARGCSGSFTTAVTITEPAILQANIASQSNLTCFENNSGAFTVLATGGTGAYSFSLDGGSTSQSTGVFTGKAAGSYTITVIDANDCEDVVNVTLTEPPLLEASLDNQTNLTCNGDHSGVFTVSATGGTGAYSFSLDGGSTSQSTGMFTGKAAGSYTITVIDANNCEDVVNVTLTEPPLLEASLDAQTNLTCHGDNSGAFTVSATGGTGAYSFSLDGGSTTQSTGVFTGKAAGSYTITVIDANNCEDVVNVTLTEPPLLEASLDAQTNLTCNGDNSGAFTVSATGGTGAYSFSLDGGSTTQSTGVFTGKAAGSYTITVIDANNCEDVVNVTLTEPPLLEASLGDQTNLTCHGDNSGAFTVSATGGTGAYSFSLDGGSTSQSTGVFTGKAAGSYTITVIDANDCEDVVNVTLTEPPLLEASLDTQTNLTCHGDNSGAFTVSATGGTGAYSFSLDGGFTSQGTGVFTEKAAGSYTITIIDANNCEDVVNVTLTEPPLLEASLDTQTNLTCFGDNSGDFTVTAAGGTGAYSFSLDGGSTSQSTGVFTGKAAGGYTITVIDANNCQDAVNVTLTEPEKVNVVVNNPSPACMPETVDLTGAFITTGSNAGLTFSYYTDMSASSVLENPDNVSESGTYFIVGTNGNNCSDTAAVQVLIKQSDQIVLSPVSACGSYTYLDSTYLESTTVVTNYTKSNGCDSTVSFVLTIEQLELVVSPPLSSTGFVDLTASSVTAGSTLPSGTNMFYFGDSNAETPLDRPDSVTLSGIYTLVAVSPMGCSDTVKVVVSFSSPCPEVITLTSPTDDFVSPEAVFVQAEQTINATNSIGNNALIQYQASGSIKLNPGFKAETGSVFQAKIGGCGEN